MKRGGCKFGHCKSNSCPLPKSGGCSLAVGTYPQRVSSPSPPGGGGGGRGEGGAVGLSLVAGRGPQSPHYPGISLNYDSPDLRLRLSAAVLIETIYIAGRGPWLIGLGV